MAGMEGQKPRRKGPPDLPLETDPRFPSGKWTGFWLQRHYIGRQWMGLQLAFINGVVRGTGTDRVGDFTMTGTYDLKTGKCSLLKAYAGAHSVAYEGRNEGDGLWIWGLWHIRWVDRGGFHMWPYGEEDPTGRKLEAEREAPADPPEVRLTPVEEPEPAVSDSPSLFGSSRVRLRPIRQSRPPVARIN